MSQTLHAPSPMTRAMELAADQANIISRRQLYGLGVTRSQLRAQLVARRWRRCLSQSISITTGPLTVEARRWVAVFEGGPRGFLDGSAALLAAGLEGFTADAIRVSVPRGARVRRTAGLNVRQTRRWQADDVAAGSGPPRARPEVAAVRAALWAKSAKQAALLVTLAVQQGLTSVELLASELLRIRRDKRRVLLGELVLELAGGVRSWVSWSSPGSAGVEVCRSLPGRLVGAGAVVTTTSTHSGSRSRWPSRSTASITSRRPPSSTMR
ncbi:hypothetical protein [Nocardioides sp.]|uniref:hypothetical protein n=1 Tax=Nocardioides sp. TaxID=35761 RepID=UPI003529809A